MFFADQQKIENGKTSVKLKRDFPRLGAKTGDEAVLVGVKGQDIFEITLVAAKSADRNLIVLAEWITDDRQA